MGRKCRVEVQSLSSRLCRRRFDAKRAFNPNPVDEAGPLAKHMRAAPCPCAHVHERMSAAGDWRWTRARETQCNAAAVHGKYLAVASVSGWEETNREATEPSWCSRPKTPAPPRGEAGATLPFSIRCRPLAAGSAGRRAPAGARELRYFPPDGTQISLSPAGARFRRRVARPDWWSGSRRTSPSWVRG